MVFDDLVDDKTDEEENTGGEREEVENIDTPDFEESERLDQNDTELCPGCEELQPRALNPETGEPLWYYKCTDKECETTTFITPTKSTVDNAPTAGEEENVIDRWEEYIGEDGIER